MSGLVDSVAGWDDAITNTVNAVLAVALIEQQTSTSPKTNMEPNKKSPLDRDTPLQTTNL